MMITNGCLKCLQATEEELDRFPYVWILLGNTAEKVKLYPLCMYCMLCNML